MALLILIIGGTLFLWIRYNNRKKEMLFSLLCGAIMNSPKQRKLWEDDIAVYEFRKDDSAYIEAYGQSQSIMSLQIEIMKDVLKRIKTKESLSKAKQILEDPTNRDLRL